MQAIRLLDPGTEANISPNTTSTNALPVGWLPNNGVYAMSSANYAATSVSASSDTNWNADSDLGNDGKGDIFVSWAVSMKDVAAVLAKPSPVDRNGVPGPRGLTGISGFNMDSAVRYVVFTQTQPTTINADLNGIGGDYDKNETFENLGVFTEIMTPANPVPRNDHVSPVR